MSRLVSAHHPAHRRCSASRARSSPRCSSAGGSSRCSRRSACGAGPWCGRRAGGAGARDWPAALRWAGARACRFVWHARDAAASTSSRYMGASYSFQGVLIEPVIYGDFGSWMRAVRAHRRDRARRCSPRCIRHGSRRARIPPTRCGWRNERRRSWCARRDEGLSKAAARRCGRCAASTSRCARASSSRSSVRRAAARPRC